MSLKAQLDQLRQGQQQRASADGQHVAAMAATPFEDQLNKIPGLSVAQKAYLRERPYALARWDLVHVAHNFSLQNGIPVDSPAYFQVIEQVLHQYGNIPFTTPAPEPTPQPTPEPRPAPMHQPTPETERDDDYAPHFVSAPPSRSEYAGSMPPPEASGRVTLSPAEREAAALAGVSEVVYAKNKLKMLQMKKAGLIRD